MLKGLKKFAGLFLLGAVFMTVVAVESPQVSAQTETRMSAIEARQKVEERFGGIIQKIEYAYDGTNPQYKDETWIKQYTNVRPDGSSGGSGGLENSGYKEIDGNLYYFNPKTGEKMTGWIWLQVGTTGKYNWKVL